jgi:alkylhydroperoxidase/carboxymuconolactone decarboxylase family protein YurZ
LTQLAFYAGWAEVFTALPVIKDVDEECRRHGVRSQGHWHEK